MPGTHFPTVALHNHTTHAHKRSLTRHMTRKASAVDAHKGGRQPFSRACNSSTCLSSCPIRFVCMPSSWAMRFKMCSTERCSWRRNTSVRDQETLMFHASKHARGGGGDRVLSSGGSIFNILVLVLDNVLVLVASVHRFPVVRLEVEA